MNERRPWSDLKLTLELIMMEKMPVFYSGTWRRELMLRGGSMAADCIVSFIEPYGKITDLLNVDIDIDLLQSMVEIYDPSRRDFVFPDITLVPTYEEYIGRVQTTIKTTDPENSFAFILNVDNHNVYKQLGLIVGKPTKHVLNKKYNG
ncbi:hypothetical protein ACFE04_020988 [Oxalis oulophora]